MPSRRRSLITLITISAVALVALLTGCGSSSASTSSAQDRATASSSTSSTSSTTAPTSGDKVSANDASIEELTAAFDAAGIAPADRWAREVDEYRPYPTNDPTMAKLRQELAKYNPSSELVDKIVAALSLP